MKVLLTPEQIQDRILSLGDYEPAIQAFLLNEVGPPKEVVVSQEEIQDTLAYLHSLPVAA
jgi:hypothetical protein